VCSGFRDNFRIARHTLIVKALINSIPS
jgi:hypothetical protein